MRPLVADMMQEDPAKRPTMEEVISRFDTILASLSTWKLRSRVVKKDDNPVIGAFRSLAHWVRRVGFVIRRVPALPVPAPPTVRCTRLVKMAMTYFLRQRPAPRIVSLSTSAPT